MEKCIKYECILCMYDIKGKIKIFKIYYYIKLNEVAQRTGYESGDPRILHHCTFIPVKVNEDTECFVLMRHRETND